jgi:hypothetical protein
MNNKISNDDEQQKKPPKGGFEIYLMNDYFFELSPKT